MDYVVFGTGYGATLMLLGWAIRTFGPGLRHQSTENNTPQSADILMAQFAWRRFISALGAVIATSGVVLVLITFFVILIDPGDSTGSVIGWTCFGLILLAVAAWSWFYVGRYGTFGVLPPRRSPNALKSPVMKPREVSVPATPASLGVSAEPVMAEQDDAHGFGPELADFEDAEDYSARYAKYQLHRPEESEEPDASTGYTGLFSDDTDDDFDVEEYDEDEYIEDTLAPGSVDEDSIDLAQSDDTVAPEAREDSSLSATEGPEVLDQEVVPEEPEPEPAPEIPADEIESHHAAVAEDIPSSEIDEDGVDQASTSNPEDESSDLDALPVYTSELEDTPEGRAEALRRIQEWQPADQDDDQRS